MEISKFESFFSKIKKTRGCWLWNGYINSGGYGKIAIKKKVYAAHRLSYELHKGPFDKKLLVCHKCDNPRCVNPKHLFLGTHKDNLYDSIKKGRAACVRVSKKKKCKNGHPFSGSNLLIRGNQRACKTCSRISKEKYRLKKFYEKPENIGKTPTGPWSKRTHCKNGHPFSGDNLKMQGTIRRCRACLAKRALDCYYRKKTRA